MNDVQVIIADAVQKLYGATVTAEISRTAAEFGDFATNVAMKLAATLQKPPRAIAEELAAELSQNGLFTKVECAGPGFINISLTDEFLLQLVTEKSVQQVHSGEKVLVEYSDPNAMKPLHAGHLYTTLVGDTIARLIEMGGAHVVRLNYGGDVGLHVAKCLWGILKDLGGELPENLSSITDRPSWLGACYVVGNNAYEDDENSRQEIVSLNKRVYEIHSTEDHSSALARIYWQCREWSYDYFKELYAQLQVKPFDRFIPESEVTQRGLEAVRHNVTKGVYTESEGAIVFKGEPYDLHTRVFINSEGLPTYECKDVGLLLTKWQDYHFDKSIVITANEQSQYYKVMLKSVEQFAPEPVNKSVHITHGVVKLQGGVKMSSRKGNVVTALEILQAARDAAAATGNPVTEDVILAAVKYAFAKNKIGGDIAYDPQESIALEGNSGPYLQYAHARACSIASKATAAPEKPTHLQDGERQLLVKLGEYVEVVNRSIEELLPHHICTYLYELAQEFNRFYEKHKVVGDQREKERLWLVTTYAATLKQGLDLLGITAPERM